MTTSNLANIINEFFTSFLQENDSSNDKIVSEWKKQENIISLNKVLEKFTKTVGKEKQKEPNKPKRAKSAYTYFCSDNREKAKLELGDEYKNAEIFSKLGDMWNILKMDQSRKTELQKYTNLAAEDKVRYKKEMSSYQSSHNNEDIPKKKI